MTRKEKDSYREADELRRIISQYEGMRFNLDCGHYAVNEVMRREVSQS